MEPSVPDTVGAAGVMGAASARTRRPRRAPQAGPLQVEGAMIHQLTPRAVYDERPVEERFKLVDLRDNVRNKDWAAGSIAPVERRECLFGAGTYTCGFRQITYAPAMLKIVDEPIVNSTDQFTRTYNFSDPVTEISVDVTNGGAITIYNNGRGIDVVIHKDTGMYVPEMIFSMFGQGENNEKAHDSFTGGTNGFGITVTGCSSTNFNLTTADAERGLVLEKRWWNYMKDGDTAAVKPYASSNGFTRVEFTPDYSNYSYDISSGLLQDLIYTRLVYTKLYVEYTRGIDPRDRPIAVKYNGEPISLPAGNTPAALAELMFPGRPVIGVRLYPSAKQPSSKGASQPSSKPRSSGKTQPATGSDAGLPWDIAVAVLDAPAKREAKSQCMSVVNGMVVPRGPHLQYLLKEISKAATTALLSNMRDKAAVNTKAVKRCLYVIACCKIPGVHWGGQSKDELMGVPASYLARYQVPDSLAEALAEHLQDLLAPSAKVPKRQKVEDSDKYIGAKLCKKCPQDCRLIAAEGDSAMAQVIIGVTNNSNLTMKKYGVISMGGVIINARAHCTIKRAFGRKIVDASDKFKENKFVCRLLSALNIKLELDYDPSSPTYTQEIRSLNYGGIIACVDQDIDGVGNIFSLLFNMFEHIWPHLVRSGYIQRFNTPVIRAYPNSGGHVLSFYFDYEYHEWSRDKDLTKYVVKYFKGLGSHTRHEIIAIFRDMPGALCTYTLDDRSAEMFNIYHGEIPELRRRELGRPYVDMPAEKQKEIRKTLTVTASDHLQYHSWAFQKDDVFRKLDSAIDGMNQSSRKIYNGVLKAFRGKKATLKVAQLAGAIAKTEEYHHGEDNLAMNITRKGFTAIGGKQLPYIVPDGNFGSRMFGGDDASSPRYIFAKYNRRLMDAIFPPADYPLLEFNYSEGNRVEPKYFIPTVPVAIGEHVSLPAHGWSLTIWARDILAIIRRVRLMILTGNIDSVAYMQPFTHGWTGRIVHYCGSEYSLGAYKIVGDKIVITELPLRVWTMPYVEALRRKIPDGIIKSVDASECDDIRILITVSLQPGGLEKMLGATVPGHVCDGVEQYLGLRKRMHHNINLIGTSGEVVEFPSYEAVVRYWFPIRRDCYQRRIIRMSILAKYTVAKYEQMLRYITECESLGLAGKAMREQSSILAAAGFLGINTEYITATTGELAFTPLSELEARITAETPGRYKYLLDLRDRNKSTENIAKIKVRLEAARVEYDTIMSELSEQPFPGATRWLNDLHELYNAVEEGRRTDWQFEEYGKFKY